MDATLLKSIFHSFFLTFFFGYDKKEQPNKENGMWEREREEKIC